MIYPPNISAFFDDNNPQILNKFASVLFITQVKALRNDVHLFPFRNIRLASLLQHNKDVKDISGESSMITVVLLQAAYIFSISSYTLKEWEIKFKEQHEIIDW